MLSTTCTGVWNQEVLMSLSWNAPLAMPILTPRPKKPWTYTILHTCSKRRLLLNCTNFSIIVNLKFCAPKLRYKRMIFGVKWFCHWYHLLWFFLAILRVGYTIAELATSPLSSDNILGISIHRPHCFFPFFPFFPFYSLYFCICLP